MPEAEGTPMTTVRIQWRRMGRPSKVTETQRGEARRRAEGATLAELVRSCRRGREYDDGVVP